MIGVSLSARWKDFNRDRYASTTDPDKHMDVYTSDSAVMCRVFPTSLKGRSLSWFTKLPPNSIDCFETLVSKFETQFDINRPHHLTSIALVNIHQEKRRSLRTFMDRFGKVALNILNWSSYMAMYHIVTALRSVPFADSLCMEPATNFDELRQRTAKLMQLEELREFRNQA